MCAGTLAAEAAPSAMWPSPPPSQRTRPARPTAGRAANAGLSSEAPLGRHEGEVSMESFIKSQMTVILQPFVEHVQQLDARLCQLKDHQDQTDASLSGVRGALSEANTSVGDLRGTLKKTDAGLAALREGLQRCSESGERTHQGLERTNGRLQGLQNQAEAAAAQALELERSVGDRMEELRAELRRMGDGIAHDLKDTLRAFTADLQDLRALGTESHRELERLKSECAQRGQLLQETRAVTDRTSATAAKLQRACDAQAAREAEMCRGLEGLQGQWAKFQPTLDSLLKDATFLKQRHEHHDSSIKAMQQTQGAAHASHQALQAAHDKLARDVHALEQGLAAAREVLSDTRDGLSRAGASGDALRASVAKAAAELQKMRQRQEGQEGRLDALSGSLDKTSGTVSDLVHEQRRAAASMQGLQRELDRSNDSLSCTRSQLDLTNDKLSGLGGELGRANEALQQLDSSVELCHAGFAGLQKGFVETGTHMASRPLTLPRLSPSKDAKALDGSRLVGGGKVVDMMGARLRGEEESTTHGSPFSARSLASSGSSSPRH